MTALVQQAVATVVSTPPGSFASVSTIFSSTPTSGNTLVLILMANLTGSQNTPLTPTGWTRRDAPSGTGFELMVCTKVAGGSEPLTVTVNQGATSPYRWATLFIAEIPGTYDGITNGTLGTNITTKALASHTPTAGLNATLLLVSAATNAYGLTASPSGYVNILNDANANDGASGRLAVWEKEVNPTSGAYGGSATWSSQITFERDLQVSFSLSLLLVADFTSDVISIPEGGTVGFEDESSGAPTSWLWDFGDGGTSTAQDPSHVYATIGTYTVSLTATNAAGSDTETKISYISVIVAGTAEPAVPAGVLLEIYAAEPGASRWGIAKWGIGKWSTAGWQDVTPQGITVGISWGSNKPDLGILHTPDAASWSVDYYDPYRILDPSNTNSPYYGDLIPGLPLRISHREKVVRVGYATGISHTFESDRGYMRGADNITLLANADVPSDTSLADTLYARTVDAIAAAGLTVQVRAPVGTDPPVSAWVTGTREWTVWEWIKDAAQEVLHIPIIDAAGFVTFRPWALPLTRGRSVASDEMIGLQVVSNWEGLYSVVRARQDISTVIERALTPPPRYGARTYTRDEITIAPGAWAETVLTDRGFPVDRWQPGDIYPLTALSVERLATIEAVERISISVPEEDPAVFVTGIVVGGEITVRGKRGGEALWRFRFHTAQTTDEPLIETGGDPTDYLLITGGGEFLYPST